MSDTIFEAVRALVDDVRLAPKRRRDAEALTAELVDLRTSVRPLTAENERLKWMIDVITNVGIGLAGGVDALNDLIHLECETHPSPTPGLPAPAIHVG